MIKEEGTTERDMKRQTGRQTEREREKKTTVLFVNAECINEMFPIFLQKYFFSLSMKIYSTNTLSLNL